MQAGGRGPAPRTGGRAPGSADETVLPIYRFYVNGRWVDRDEVMLISGVDDVTAKSLKSRT